MGAPEATPAKKRNKENPLRKGDLARGYSSAVKEIPSTIAEMCPRVGASGRKKAA
jgi:hypothetical protein